MPRKKYDVNQMLADHKAGMNQSEIAVKHGTNQAYVSLLLRGHPDWKPRGGRVWDQARKAWAAELYKTGLTFGEVAKRMRTGSRYVRKALRELGIPSRASYRFQEGRANPSWAGGRVIRKGYAYLYLPNHPLATQAGYVLEHRLVMEGVLGRFLDRREVVHHRNGDTLDNRPVNLELFASNADHLAATLKGKCPKWSDEGKARIKASPRRRAS